MPEDNQETKIALLFILSNAISQHFVTISDIIFELLPNGTKGYAYILHNKYNKLLF